MKVKFGEYFSVEKLKKFYDSYFNKLCSDLPAEKLHIKFCKYVLEVNRHSTNLAVTGELGRYPLYIEVLLSMIKYFTHLSSQECSGLVAEAFEASRKLHSGNKKSWYNNITEILDFFNIDKNKIINLKSTLKSYILQCIFLKYKNIWQSELFNDKRSTSSGNKLEHIDYSKISLFFNLI